MPAASEDDLIDAVRKVLSDEAPGVIVPVGDDAAVVEPGRHHVVLSTDMLVEGVHFTLDTISAQDLGHKALTVNVSDLAAMGAAPRYALIALGLPSVAEGAWVMELYGGLREAAGDLGMTIVGGDMSRSEQHVISVAVVGAVAKGRAVTRSGARPGDALVVTGTLGAAAAGLALAKSPPQDVRDELTTDAGREVVRAHLRPAARIGEGETLAHAGASAMIDLSDGLAIDLHRVCAESQVGARIRVADLPIAAAAREVADALRLDPVRLALGGGEDYELLAAIPHEVVEPTRHKLAERYGSSLTEIGEITESGVVIEDDGKERPLERTGWDHFA
ncbi:MAG TPA: thiamine-phosphate kinase [Actinomycetota bacterium]|nr:thiamine-phosphate kinase [Actinomycetota bacterium]